MTVFFDGGPLAHFFIAICCHEMSAKRRKAIDMDMMAHINRYAPFCAHLMTTTRNKKVGQRPTIKNENCVELMIPTIGL